MRGTRAKDLRRRTHLTMEKLNSIDERAFITLYRALKRAWNRRGNKR